MNTVRILETGSGAMEDLYSVVTDLAKFRGKSTSTPFMMARSEMVSTGIHTFAKHETTYGMREVGGE